MSIAARTVWKPTLSASVRRTWNHTHQKNAATPSRFDGLPALPSAGTTIDDGMNQSSTR